MEYVLNRWAVQRIALIRCTAHPEGIDITMRDRTFTGWRKSSLSSGGDNCVEVGLGDDGTIGVRDTKQHGEGPILVFHPGEWDAFIGGVRAGEFDLI
jgi:hypothetical protein